MISNCALEIFVDGACRGNPGPAAIGIVFKDGDRVVTEIARPIGEATNNIAEYTALICALQEALVRKVNDVRVFTDSELMFCQLTGSYKVKDERLKCLYDQVQQLKRGFNNVELVHVTRDKNKHADKLAAGALSKPIIKKQAKMVATLFHHSAEESPSSQG